MRFLTGYLVFIAIRLGVTVAVGWTAAVYARDQFTAIASGLEQLSAISGGF